MDNGVDRSQVQTHAPGLQDKEEKLGEVKDAMAFLDALWQHPEQHLKFGQIRKLDKQTLRNAS